jgi:two-component system chemotaxis response regulator CheB
MAIRVLVVDDSALVRSILTKGLSAYDDIEVIRAVPDVYAARDAIVTEEPDVLTLDIEMPRMDGVEFLRRLMPQRPTPVVIVSALATPQANLTFKALHYGAVDFVTKPSSSLGNTLTDVMEELAAKVRVAAAVDPASLRSRRSRSTPERLNSTALDQSTDKVVAIGASTGGTVALEEILKQLPADIPGIVITQHMPPLFTKQFAARLNEIAAPEVKEAESGDTVVRGRVLIAPGEAHLEVLRSGGRYVVHCRDGEKVNGHRPSVEVLFNSVAKHVGANAVGIMLTGMGDDGATAMVSLRRSGARTIAQDRETSVVYGMPKAAYEKGGAERLVPLSEIPSAMVALLEKL